MAVSPGTGCTINVTAAGEGKCYTKVVAIGGLSGASIAFTGATIIWNGGSAPTVAANSVFVFTSSDSYVWGTVISAS